MIKSFLLSAAILVLLSFTATAQVCGPNCPVCSGTTDGKLTPLNIISLQGLYIPGGEEETGMVSLKYGVFNWLDAGVSYTFKAGKFIWNARLQLISQDEDGWRPSLVLGTGSIRAGHSDQSVYANLIKTFELSPSFAFTLSGGMASLASDLGKLYGIAGVTLVFAEKISAFVNYDGINFHEGATWTVNDWLTAGLMIIETRDPAIMASISIPLSGK